MRTRYYSIIICLSIFGLLCGTNVSACQYRNYYVKGVKDLCGETLQLPDNTTIVFKKGGKIVNGTICGKNTKIKKAYADCIGVTLMGTWNVKDISDIWFDKTSLTDNAIIKSLNALQSDRIKQILRIERNHCLKLSSDFNTGLSVTSNTMVLLNAVLSIEGNSLERYNIVSISGKNNVKWEGGEVRGDVGKHRYIVGSTSEWGFGVYIYGSRDITITGLKSSLCTGDGFYISGDGGNSLDDYAKASKNIVLRNCTVYDDRREGISLVHAESVLIEDCKAINMGQTEYTAPSYGINIEPNKGKGVRSVIIRRYVSENTRAEYAFSSGGYQLSGGISNRDNIRLEDCRMDKGVAIMSGAVTILDSKMSKVTIYPVDMPSGKVMFRNCTITGGDGIQLDGRMKTVIAGNNMPQYEFYYCEIVPGKAYKPIPAMIWGTDIENINGVFVFHNCTIKLPKNEGRYNLIISEMPASMMFDNCEIDSEEYAIAPRGAKFQNCIINCQFIDGTTSITGKRSDFIKCSITTRHPTKTVVNEKGVRLLQDTTIEFNKL